MLFLSYLKRRLLISYINLLNLLYLKWSQLFLVPFSADIETNWLPFSLGNILLLSCPFPLFSFSRLNKCISLNFSMWVMLTNSLITPVALLWILSNSSVSFLEGGVPNWIKRSSSCLTTSEQCNSYLLRLLYNITINLSQNCICFIFLKAESCYWLTFAGNSLLSPDRPQQWSGLSVCCGAFLKSQVQRTSILLRAILSMIWQMSFLQFAKILLDPDHFLPTACHLKVLKSCFVLHHPSYSRK